MVGITYSLWTYGYLGGTNTLQTGNVSLKLLESTSEIIDIKNALPKGDNEGKTQEETYNFAVTTTASRNTAISYSINIEKLEVDEGYTSLEDKDIKVYLEDYNNKEIVAPSLISNIGTKLYSKTNIHNSNNKEITDKYKLRVWLDKEVDISNWTKETKLEYKFKIGVTSKEVDPNNIEPNMPKLDTNMIPVYYDETTETWKKADGSNENNNWYDYNNKKWANSVTVSEENRSKYLSANPGIEIPMEDILTMQVWIPRYKYKVWNYNADGKQTSKPQEIQITFENENNNTSEITCEDKIQGENGDGTSETCKLKATNEVCTDETCNNKTYTHPAFTFGDEELTGFWIGKFELTGTINDITVKPNLSSLRYQSVSSFETNIMNMKNSGNKYGFTTNADTHMIKNMEWGAVAYLSHSKYGTCSDGICSEVNANNSSGFYTGRSGGAPGGSIQIDKIYTNPTSTDYYNNYGFYTYDGYLLDYDTNTKSTTKDISKVASTTKNIYGVYDMSGGAHDYTMANEVNVAGTEMFSTFSGYDAFSYPSVKYYDKYSYSIASVDGDQDRSIKKTKLGDAIKEAYSHANFSWYNGYSYVSPWISRGGTYAYGTSVSLFFSNNFGEGRSASTYSSRLIIS